MSGQCSRTFLERNETAKKKSRGLADKQNSNRRIGSSRPKFRMQRTHSTTNQNQIHGSK